MTYEALLFYLFSRSCVQPTRNKRSSLLYIGNFTSPSLYAERHQLNLINLSHEQFEWTGLSRKHLTIMCIGYFFWPLSLTPTLNSLSSAHKTERAIRWSHISIEREILLRNAIRSKNGSARAAITQRPLPAKYAAGSVHWDDQSTVKAYNHGCLILNLGQQLTIQW